MTAPVPPRLDLDAIEARADAATPGPWEAVHVDDGEFYGQPPTFDIWSTEGGRNETVFAGGPAEDGGPTLGAAELQDVAFVVNARRDVPALVGEVRRLQAENESLQRRLFPGQGESYANVVKRQRSVIHVLDRLAAGYRAERDALRAAIQVAHPVIQYVSRGRGYVGVEPYPDATARRANALIGECLAAAVEGTETP